MKPPSTGSAGLLAVTATASGLANAVLTTAVCGVLPATGVRVKPWLWKAPMSTRPARGNPRWSVAGTPRGRATADGGAPREQSEGERRTAVVAQGRQQRVDRRRAGADLVAPAPVADPGHPRPVADQVVRADRIQRARTSLPPFCRRRSCWSASPCAARVQAAAEAAASAGVADDGAIDQRQRAFVGQAAAWNAGGVAADGAIGQRQRPGVV